MNKKEIINKIISVAKSVLPNGSTLLLYGSRARGDEKADSDWDLLILVDKNTLVESDYDMLSFPFTLLGWNIGQTISPQLYTRNEWENLSYLPFYKNVEHDKIQLA